MTVGVLGLGSIGMRHARNLRALGETVIGFDPAEAQRTALEKEGGKAAESREALFEAADAVVICSPNNAHLADLTDAVAAGCHALVEKPLSHTLESLDAVLAQADKNKLTVMVGMNMRFHAVARQAKAHLDSGALGKIIWARFIASSYLPSWRPQQDYRKGYTADPKTGGVTFDMIHEFDLACHLLGSAAPAAAHARKTGQLEIAAEDCIDAVLKHDSGVCSAIHLDYASKIPLRSFEIQGEKGLLRGDLLGRTLSLQTNNEPPKTEKFAGEWGDDYITEMKAFLSAIKGGKETVCSGRQGRDILNTVIKTRKLAGLPQ